MCCSGALHMTSALHSQILDKCIERLHSCSKIRHHQQGMQLILQMADRFHARSDHLMLVRKDRPIAACILSALPSAK